MEESKTCIYCKEAMTYGPRTQVVSTTSTTTKGGKAGGRQHVSYVVYCWYCPMKDDNCDIVLDTITLQ